MNPHWRSWFALGVVRFGLRPKDFWALSLAEWLALLTSVQGEGVAGLRRSDLQSLLNFDKESQERTNG